MQIIGSNDISVLRIKVTFDISNPLPQVLLENLSQGNDLASCSYWFVVKSPTGTIIHEGTELSPDITGIWSSDVLNDAWPRPFSQIEFSGAPYTFQAFVKDGDGNIYEGDIQAATICRPNGNTPKSKNTYGLSECEVRVKCQEAGVYFQDVTNHSYQGLDGTIGASVLKLVYPIDETGNVPTPFTADHFSVVQVPITYSSDNYQFQATSVYDYDMGDDTHILIRYQSFNPKNGSPAVRFAVFCNIDLEPLVCEYTKFIQKLESGDCADAEDAHQKLVLMNSKMVLIFMGMDQPLTGIDVPALIEEVQAIGGFTCDCCNAATGIIPTSASVIDGYTFQVVSVCGDISGTVNKNGNLIQFLLQDKSYVFKMCDVSPASTTAFSIGSELNGCQKTYCLAVDVNQFGYDLATAIAADANLLNIWQALIGAGSSGQIIVDGGCVFSSGTACDYTLNLSNIPVNTTFALLTSMKVGNTVYALNYSFNLTNLPGLQTYLNSLGLGTFTVTNPSGQNVTITSLNNTNDIQSLTYKIAGVTYLASLAKSCTGYTPISVQQAIQNLITYLCDLDDTQVQTSDNYTICYIDPADGVSKTQTINGGEALATFITALLTRGCQTIEYIESLNAPDCDGMKKIFPTSVQPMQSNDFMFGLKAGECARILPKELFLAQLIAGYSDPAIVAAFCNMVQLCAGLLPCANYDTFSVSVEPFDADCPQVIRVGLVGDAPITITSCTWANAPVGSQTIVVEYADASTPFPFVWVVAGSSTVTSIGINGTLDTPILLSGAIPGSSYYVRAYNACQSPASYSAIQGPFTAQSPP